MCLSEATIAKESLVSTEMICPIFVLFSPEEEVVVFEEDGKVALRALCCWSFDEVEEG
jgi:hypothetical protein